MTNGFILRDKYLKKVVNKITYKLCQSLKIESLAIPSFLSSLLIITNRLPSSIITNIYINI